MLQPSRLIKRLIVPALLAVGLLVAGVVLAAPPIPSFTITGPAGNECGTWTFTSTSTDPDDDIATIEWNLGGTPATGTPVQQAFGTPGARVITMSATDGTEGAGDLGAETVPAVPQTANVVNGGPPNAVISPTSAAAQPNQVVNFSAAGSTDAGSGSIANYSWDLDEDGTFETSTGTTAATSASFAAAGSHSVGLRVTDNCGATDTAFAGLFVNNSPPTASFTATPNPAAIGADVAFDASASADPGGSIATYEWSWDGDATFEANSAAATATHAYAAAGNYLVRLRVTDNDGGQATAFQTVRVNAKPVAQFSYSPNPPVINQAATFNAAGSADPDGTIASYAWDLDGNGTFEAAGATPSHVYTTAGTVNVKLRVTDNDGTVSDVTTRPVDVQPTKPNVNFTFSPAHPTPGQKVTLTSTSRASGAAALVSTQWDLHFSPLADFVVEGAGGSITTSFATAGDHTVAVKVTESSGGYAIVSRTIPVNAPPNASFTVAPAKPREGRAATFASTSSDSDGIKAQEWDFNNDGKFERSGAVVSTKALKAGTRVVKLRVTDSLGASTVSPRTIKVAKKLLGPPVDVRRSIGFARRDWGVVLVGLRVTVPRQTTVTVQCKGSGCPRGTFRKATRKKKAMLSFGNLRGNVRAGAKIVVISAHAGRVTAYDTYLIRGDHRYPVLREQCRYGKTGKPRACP